MTSVYTIALTVLALSLNGCGQDYSLSPPVDSELVTVTVKVPKELKAEIMKVMYRSATCKRISQGPSGQRLESDGHHGFDVQLKRQGQSDLYQVKLPKDGGGACRWHLANVIFGVTYADPTRFGENVTAGAGGGVVVIFDYNNSPRGGAGIEVDGDLTIKKEYYPWLKENFLGGYSKRISLVGEGSIYLSYQALQARQVYFEPILHSDFTVYSTQPKVKKKGNHTTFTYPDGSVVADGQSQPDFLKLQMIRTGRDRDCFDVWRYANCPGRRPQLLPDWLPEPDQPGFGRYLIVDEWGNKLPSYFYRLVGENGEVFQGLTELNGRTNPLPESARALSKAEFPERVW
ncbi:UNVERIFIED_ORG: hypothetical protein J2W87_005590 [Pseudomonas putida]|nr:hypothetical protein [Pseudomonas putida]